ncbi:hypothetical protein [Erysipelothrix anatis]|uniref:hypothetical protein n=1 Tax=Erysipelothrix anatis TaxID=2683713 RepID=UPI0013577F85|nr:hypothetical protein [Erysipelothrix anatis]
MNKYQEALNRLKFQENWQEGNELQILQELVDKETPMNPVFLPYRYELGENENFYGCRNCEEIICGEMHNDHLRFKHCYHCGQRIDWTNDEA